MIATGGGCVTKERNYPLLHQNGRIFWLKRDISALATEGRPLSQVKNLDEMYQVRKPLYEAFSDHEVNNDGDLTETIYKITAILEEYI